MLRRQVMTNWDVTRTFTPQSVRSSSARVLVHGFARWEAWALIAILICVPALTRAFQHEQPSAHRVGFRFSKSVEPPPERFTATHLLGLRPAPAPRDVTLTCDSRLWGPEVFVTYVRVVVGPGPSRAPPASS